MGWRVTAVRGLDTLSADEREPFETALHDDPYLHVLRERHLVVYEMETADDPTLAAAPSIVHCVAPFSPGVRVGMLVAATLSAAVRQQVEIEDGNLRWSPQLHLAAELVPEEGA